MPVQIGAKTHDFSDPTGLLSDCHRRIEMFLRSLQGAAKIIDLPLTGEARGALESALRYFREAAPKHTKDEEESLFPRLRQIHNPEIENALSALDAIEDDHRRADALHAEVHVLGMLCLEKGIFHFTRRVNFAMPLMISPPSTASTFRSKTISYFRQQNEHCPVLRNLSLQMKWHLGESRFRNGGFGSRPKA